MPEGMRKYFDIDEFILDRYKYTSCEGNGEFYIVYKDDDGMLELTNNYLNNKCWIVEYSH